MPKVLGIETSCDDTSIAIMQDGKILYENTLNDFNKSNTNGGIVPEVVSRDHERNFVKIIKDIKDKNLLTGITHIAYTSNPGLPGSLHVGKVLAKTLSCFLEIPLIAINHLEAHAFSGFIEKEYIEDTYLCMVVSGGHSSIYKIDRTMQIEDICHTADDAVGEVYDKISRTLKMGFPGGPPIDKMYDDKYVTENIIANIKFNDESKFSFSGIKSSVINYINKRKEITDLDKKQICSTFQSIVVENLVNRLEHFSNKLKIKKIIIGGGVACNSLLRKKIIHRFGEENTIIPSPRYCTDNATMICKLAELKIKYKKLDQN